MIPLDLKKYNRTHNSLCERAELRERVKAILTIKTTIMDYFDFEFLKDPPPGAIPDLVAKLSSPSEVYFISLVRFIRMELQRKGEKNRLKKRAYEQAEIIFFAWYGRRSFASFEYFRIMERRKISNKEEVQKVGNIVSKTVKKDETAKKSLSTLPKNLKEASK